jgi:hypothetical protein
MPYYIYKVQSMPILQLAKLEQHDVFRDASARAKDLRREMALADGSQVKVIYAENELEAEDILSQVREPQPELGDD